MKRTERARTQTGLVSLRPDVCGHIHGNIPHSPHHNPPQTPYSLYKDTLTAQQPTTDPSLTVQYQYKNFKVTQNFIYSTSWFFLNIVEVFILYWRNSYYIQSVDYRIVIKWISFINLLFFLFIDNHRYCSSVLWEEGGCPQQRPNAQFNWCNSSVEFHDRNGGKIA